MNVVDSSGWIEFFTDSPNAAFFAEPLDDLEALVVPTICILEVFRFLLRNRNEADALQAVAAMRAGQVVDLDAELALLAGQLGVELGLPLADSVVYATGQRMGATVWSQDADFDGLENVRFIAAGK